jgi:hypothetical protein
LSSSSNMHWIDVWFTTFSHLQGYMSTSDVHAIHPHWTKTWLRLRLSSWLPLQFYRYCNLNNANANEAAHCFSKRARKGRECLDVPWKVCMHCKGYTTPQCDTVHSFWFVFQSSSLIWLQSVQMHLHHLHSWKTLDCIACSIDPADHLVRTLPGWL